ACQARSKERRTILADLPRVSRLWVLLCAAGPASLIAARALHYLDLPLPRIVDWLLDELMHASLQLTVVFFFIVPRVVPLLLSRFGLVLLLVAVLAFYWRPWWFVRREDGKRFATAPWLYSCLCGGLMLFNLGLDPNPWVALGCAGSAALAFVRWHRAVTAAVLVAAFVAAWARLGPPHPRRGAPLAGRCIPGFLAPLPPQVVV